MRKSGTEILHNSMKNVPGSNHGQAGPPGIIVLLEQTRVRFHKFLKASLTCSQALAAAYDRQHNCWTKRTAALGGPNNSLCLTIYFY